MTDKTSEGYSRTGLRTLIVVLMLMLTAGSVWWVRELTVALQQTRFSNEVQRMDSAIAQRIVAYVQVLRSGLGLFQSSEEVTRAEWENFIAALRLGEHYPGFKIFTYAPAVRAEELPAFLARVRSEPPPQGLANPSRLADYELRFGGKDVRPLPLHAPILYVAPFTPDNQRAMGLDLMQESMRRGLLEQTAATGDALLSPRIKLMQVTVPRQGALSEAAFVIFVAIKREGQVVGWLTAACQAEHFMSGLLGDGRPALEFEIFDGSGMGPESLLYSTAGVDAQRGPVPLPEDKASPLTHLSSVSMPGRKWTVRYRAPEDFFSISEVLAPWLVALGGLLATLLFYAVARASSQWRAQADVLRIAEAAVRHQATHDPLTGLANRVLFMDRLQSALKRVDRRSQRLALIYLDIDGFKPINDTHGHRVGDELLKQIAKRLEGRLRREDTAARLGGDEFALILESAVIPPEEAQRIGEELIEVLRQPYEIVSDATTLTVIIGASVGMAHFPEQGADPDALVAAADAAMYRAKRSGRNRCVQA